ncbi:unnamed protein product [Fraxinus pennsylvanica]|uniref:Uncharacterized protein n=1 Tax=Fraxinus pennsylvanica TaxID=56036 RepID=A0AAD2AEA5_9LAMI|nr:unnamed protein product [Fraxinus pennsylvanica]
MDHEFEFLVLLRVEILKNGLGASPLAEIHNHIYTRRALAVFRPELPKEKTHTMSSVAMSYTGGDIRRSGELDKMFIPTDGSRSKKSGLINCAPSRTGSFNGSASLLG